MRRETRDERRETRPHSGRKREYNRENLLIFIQYHACVHEERGVVS